MSCTGDKGFFYLGREGGIFRLDVPATSASAKGIGAQLANSSNSPIAVNTLIKTDLNTQDEIGSYNIPMSARYTQVSTALANASVTLTLTYQ